MKNQNLQKGKKLNKKELRVITGGLLPCADPETGVCEEYRLQCVEFQCKHKP
ncbi:bacteriocin [Chryseobacterium sp. MIQD13]|uniref:bacteriocin n=1 Tax=Chryseobacterium sp. MIQD13 TaxID=3422310 RepID=UPI003D2C9855